MIHFTYDKLSINNISVIHSSYCRKLDRKKYIVIERNVYLKVLIQHSLVIKLAIFSVESATFIRYFQLPPVEIDGTMSLPRYQEFLIAWFTARSRVTMEGRGDRVIRKSSGLILLKMFSCSSACHCLFPIMNPYLSQFMSSE